MAVLEKWLFITMGSALSWTLEGQVIRGVHGEFLGLLNCQGRITLPKEGGQASQTIVLANLEKSVGRLLPESRNSKFTVWLKSPSADKQVKNATDGKGVYRYKDAEGTADTLFGFPVISSEHCSALGDEGDIILTDLSRYQVLAKSERKDISGHLNFLTDESAFRLIFQADGMPTISTPITPRFGSDRLSSIVTL